MVGGGVLMDVADFIAEMDALKTRCSKLERENKKLRESLGAAEGKIPYTEIVGAYNDIVAAQGKGKKCNSVKSREASIRARWAESSRHRSVDFWNNYFNSIVTSSGTRWMFYDSAGRKKEKWLTLDYLIRLSSFYKIIDSLVDGG